MKYLGRATNLFLKNLLNPPAPPPYIPNVRPLIMNETMHSIFFQFLISFPNGVYLFKTIETLISEIC